MNLSCLCTLNIPIQVLSISARCLTIVSCLNRTFLGRRDWKISFQSSGESSRSNLQTQRWHSEPEERVIAPWQQQLWRQQQRQNLGNADFNGEKGHNTGVWEEATREAIDKHNTIREAQVRKTFVRNCTEGWVVRGWIPQLLPLWWSPMSFSDRLGWKPNSTRWNDELVVSCWWQGAKSTLVLSLVVKEKKSCKNNHLALAKRCQLFPSHSGKSHLHSYFTFHQRGKM